MSNHFFSSNKKSLEKPSSSNESGLTNDFRDDLDFDIPSVEDLQRGDLVSDVPHNYNIPSMNTLAQDAVVTGNINVDGELKIYGKVIGDITSSSNVIIGESGVVEGNVKATGMEVAGRFNGNAEISGEFLASSTGTIYGDLVIETLNVNAGAKMRGSILMNVSEAEFTAAVAIPKLNGRAVQD